MQFVKKHLFLIIIIASTVLSGIIGAVLIAGQNNQIQKFKVDVDKIIAAEEGFITSKYALITDNVIRAEKNYSKIQEEFDETIKQLEEQFAAPVVDADMTPLKFKLYLRQFCIKMENLLRGEDVYMPDDLKYFSYDKYMQPDVLPNNEEISLMRKQIEIINELIYLVSQAQVDRLVKFRRISDHRVIKREFYNFMPFELVLVGDIERIQHFLNSLNEAKYFFILRTFEIKTRAVKMKNPPSSKRRNSDNPLSMRERLAFSSKAAELTATMIVDYFEFHKKE